MKSKRLIALLIILCFIVLLVVLGSTIFTMQSFSLSWLTSRAELSNETIETLSKNITLPIGESVFFVDKNTLINQLERENPYLQVVSIETVFPNSAVIYAAERKQLYAVDVDNKYVILDKELKILNIISADDLFAISEGNRPAIVKIDNDNINLHISDDKLVLNISGNKNEFAIGDLFNIEEVSLCLQDLTKSLLEANYKDQSIRGFISEIIIKLGLTKNLQIKTRCGISIDIIDCLSDDELTQKLVCGISAYEKVRMEPYFITSGKISVFKNIENGKIYAVHNYE